MKPKAFWLISKKTFYYRSFEAYATKEEAEEGIKASPLAQCELLGKYVPAKGGSSEASPASETKES